MLGHGDWCHSQKSSAWLPMAPESHVGDREPTQGVSDSDGGFEKWASSSAIKRGPSASGARVSADDGDVELSLPDEALG
jgi:hypothetical protein